MNRLMKRVTLFQTAHMGDEIISRMMDLLPAKKPYTFGLI